MGIGKIDLSEAKSIAVAILEHISPAMDRIEIAGSVRRKKPVVGDIELVGIPADRAKMIRLLSDIGQHIKPSVPGAVPWLPKENAKYLRLRLPQEINLDLFCGTRDNWGGLFLMRTGSGVDQSGNTFNGFTPGMFGRWKKVSGGGRMTECMPTTKDGEQIPLHEEQDFFDLLGLDFILPEARTSKHVIKRYVRSA